MKGWKGKRILNSNKRIWQIGETPFCELRSVEVSEKGIFLRLTPRGEKERKMREENERREQKSKRGRGTSVDLVVAWLFGPILPSGRSMFS